MSFVYFRASFEFNRQAVTRPLLESLRERNQELGTRTKARAKSLLKYDNRSSRPGRPPSVHRRKGRAGKHPRRAQPSSPLRELIEFEAVGIEMVAGPKLLPGANPNTLRKIEEKRPFMNPAFKTELARVPSMWGNAISS